MIKFQSIAHNMAYNIVKVIFIGYMFPFYWVMEKFNKHFWTNKNGKFSFFRW